MENLQVDTIESRMNSDADMMNSEAAGGKSPKKRGRKPGSKKAAKVPAKRRGKGATGKRYTEDQKKEVLGFMNSMGRGGLTAASKKFKISMLTLSRWAKGSPAGGAKRRGRPPGSGKTKVKGKRGRPAGVRAVSSAAFNKRAQKGIQKGLKRMAHGIEMLAQAFAHLT